MQRNKSRSVRLDIENFRELIRRVDTRATGRIDTMPDALLAEFKDAVAAYERDDDKA